MTTHTAQPPQAGSQAWQRFLAHVEKRFETVCWNDAQGEPTLLSIIDLASGESLSLTPHNPRQDASSLLVFLIISVLDGSLSARWLLPGPPCEAVGLVTTRQMAAATCPAILHPPARGPLPIDAWFEISESIAEKIWAPPPPQDSPVVLVLLDRGALTMAAVGPFDTAAAARAWRTDQHNPDRYADRLILAT